MKRALVFFVALEAALGAQAAVAQVDPGIHQAFVADNHLVYDSLGRLHLVYLGWDGAQTDVFLTTSEDEGFSWSTPVNLTSTPDMSSSEPPDVAVDPDGNVAVVWSEGRGDTAAVYLAYGGSAVPPPVQILAETGNLASGPKIAFDPGGDLHVVWYDEGDPDSRLAYVRHGGSTTDPVYIGPQTGYVQWPSITVDGDGNLYVVFSYTPAYGAAPIDLFLVTSTDGGWSWSDTTRLSETGLSSKYPNVLVHPYSNAVHVVWQEGEGSASEIYHRSSDGKSWTAPENLSNTAGAASQYPTLSMDDLGTLHLVWSDEVDGDYDVYLRSYDGSAWQARENLSNTTASSLGSTQLERVPGYGTLVCWVEGNAAPYRLVSSSRFSEVLFTDAAADARLDSTGYSRAAAWGDVDADGWDDLLVVKWPISGGRTWVHKNLGATFEGMQSLALSGSPNAAAWGDFDNDDFRDLAVVALGGTVWLYRNAGGDSLHEAGSSLGISASTGGYAVVWADYDRDGRLDLFVTGGSGGPNVLYHNDGAAFSDSAVAAGVDASGADCHGAAWGDYDGDGWPDLYVAVYGPNLLFHNEGDGTFTEVAAAAGVDRAANSEACSWADFDLDGDLDLFVLGNLGANALYRNDGGAFVDVSASLVPAVQGQGSVAVWADADSDGDPDLFVSGATTAFYRNNGSGGFAEAGSPAGLRRTGQFYGAGWADYDGDGDPDLFLSNGANAGKDFLFLNGDSMGPAHNWLAVDLRGTVSNRDAVGARVQVYAAGAMQLQEKCGGLGFSQNSGTLRFGLGDAASADSLIVRWPSGTVDRKYAVGANQRMAITEGTTAPAVWPGDTDNDGDVDGEDVLPLVVYWHTQVTARSARNPYAWEAQPLPAWHPDPADYADADANGEVEPADLLAIGVNWGKTHLLAPGACPYRPLIADHGAYLDRYQALYRSVETAAPGSGAAKLREYLETLIALAGGGSGFEDAVAGFSPNPLRAGAAVQFSTARAGRVSLAIYDVTGRRVRTLVEEELPPGAHGVFWDGRNAAGEEVAPGVYLCRMERAGPAGSIKSKKLVVVR